LDAEVELLAPVGLPARALARHPRITTELRGIHHFDALLLLHRQVEELPGKLEQAFDLVQRNAMPVEIEEADVARCIAQVPQERGARRRALLEEREIENGEKTGHGCLLPLSVR